MKTLLFILCFILFLEVLFLGYHAIDNRLKFLQAHQVYRELLQHTEEMQRTKWGRINSAYKCKKRLKK